jgi:predicted alpha/beta superfamily hydrolase
MNTHVEVASGYAPIIETIEEEYEIPQLKRKRRISALLPYNYYQTDKTYRVLYLNDGQNLFDEFAPFGNWAIDKSLEQLASRGMDDLVVIAIDHGGEDRITEYLPYFDPKVGKGQGELYLRFMEETLIPYVNKKYRVHTDRVHTGIGGSSMGGLISLFAGLNHQNTFGKLMIFSPSLWIAPKIFQQAEHFHPELPTELYIYAGGKESQNHMPNVLRFKKQLLGEKTIFNHIRLHLSLNPEGTHSEAFWRDEFPKATEWLYFHQNQTT